MSSRTSSLRLFPFWLWIPAIITLVAVAGPILALFIRAPWPEIPALLVKPEALAALRLSLLTSGITTVICFLFGLPLSIILVRSQARWARISRGIIMIPLVLSPVVSGICLLYFWGRNGLVGMFLADYDIQIAFTTVAVVLVQCFVAMPFFVVSAMDSLGSVDEELQLAAANAGASNWQILRHITLPLAAPGIISGIMLAFARSLGEYGATITFAGSVENVTRTLPLQIELSLNSSTPQLAVGLSLILISLYLVVLLGTRLAASLGRNLVR